MAGVGMNIAVLTLTFVIIAAVVFVITDALGSEAGMFLLVLGASILVTPVLAVESYLKALERVELVGFYRTAVLVPGLVAKIWLATRGAPLVWICWITAAEYWVIAAIALLVTRSMLGKAPSSHMLSAACATFPGVLSVASASLLVTFFMRSPNIMMPALSTFSDLAGFALAFQLVQLPAVAGGIALAAAYPRFVHLAQDGNRSTTEKLAQRLMSLCVLATYAVAGAFFLFGGTLLTAIFGARYQAAGSSLWVLALSLPIVLTGQVRSYLIYINNQPRLHVVNALVGIAAIWLIGYALIPRYSGVGAAVAYTVATAICGWLTSFLFDSTRVAGKMQLHAFLIRYPS
jgi:PST family polysaccharide transporter